MMRHIGSIVHVLSCTLLLQFSVSCGNQTSGSDIFNGEIINIEDKNVVEKEVEFRKLELKGISSGFFSVCDTLAIYMTPQSPSHWYQVFNLNTGEELGKFAMKGNGHEEFGPVGNIDNFHVEDNELKTLVFEANKERAHLWNITKSLAEGTTVIEREVKMPWRKETKGACFNEIFMKDSNTAYAKVQSLPVNEYEATLPYYQIMDLKNGEQTSGINIFKRPVVNKKTDCLPEIPLDSHDVMKPDGTKIAQAMLNVPQLNIIDTGSKTVEGHLLDCDMALSDLETRKAFNLHFIRICADDDYIYTVYYGEEPWGANDIPCLNRLFVFDWDGNLVSKIVTKHCMDRIAVDNRNRILYTTSFLDEKLYYIKTDELVGAPLITTKRCRSTSGDCHGNKILACSFDGQPSDPASVVAGNLWGGEAPRTRFIVKNKLSIITCLMTFITSHNFASSTSEEEVKHV